MAPQNPQGKAQAPQPLVQALLRAPLVPASLKSPCALAIPAQDSLWGSPPQALIPTPCAPGSFLLFLLVCLANTHPFFKDHTSQRFPHKVALTPPSSYAPSPIVPCTNLESPGDTKHTTPCSAWEPLSPGKRVESRQGGRRKEGIYFRCLLNASSLRKAPRRQHLPVMATQVPCLHLCRCSHSHSPSHSIWNVSGARGPGRSFRLHLILQVLKMRPRDAEPGCKLRPILNPVLSPCSHRLMLAPLDPSSMWL